ncbi:MAG: 50S ribosomal protein L32e [Caldisphaeraceae archaeon]|nr:50S ribosomal protein L32e [Caldisphaeraceae archaeon]
MQTQVEKKVQKSINRKRLQKIIMRKHDISFVRYLSWRFKRLETTWRKPKGNDSKMRLQRKGYPPIVKVGYKNDKRIRGLHPSGLIPVLVSNPKDIEGLTPKVHIIYISSKVGLRKRVELEDMARKMGFRIANGGEYGL